MEKEGIARTAIAYNAAISACEVRSCIALSLYISNLSFYLGCWNAKSTM
jgi:hypothetical protein